MIEGLDRSLIAQVGRRARGGSSPMLDLGERIAANLFWREGVHVTVIMKVFKVGKNTLYGNSITGGEKYVHGEKGIEVNEIIDRIGEKAAAKQYVTHAMTMAINAGNRELAERRRLKNAA